MDGVNWGHAKQRLALHRKWTLPTDLSHGQKARDPSTDWKRVHFRMTDDARRALGFGTDQIWKLRRLLAPDCYNLRCMTDAQVMEQAAVMLARGELALFELVATVAAKHSPASAAAAVSTSTARATARPTRKPRAERVVERPRPAKPPEPATSTYQPKPESFDQDAQAATLRLAAVNGTPFCEVCEKRKGGRVEPRSRQGAA